MFPGNYQLNCVDPSPVFRMETTNNSSTVSKIWDGAHEAANRPMRIRFNAFIRVWKKNMETETFS